MSNPTALFLLERNKRSLLDGVIQQAFKAQITTNFEGVLQVYSDGFVADERVEASAVIPQYLLNILKPTAPTSSVPATEIAAMLEDQKACENLNSFQNVVRLTDSKSGLHLVQ
ncbi:hypothetical protein QYM36_003979 [Artemia franciscana]|uniref:Uncharacterized protein n=1 Tax=Artemia franciscana TaxID=6661 RepID=A0AA88I4U6_ARTSF|nr:hypothetical protein QYM36_003979 [Artemia franciscana]